MRNLIKIFAIIVTGFSGARGMAYVPPPAPPNYSSCALLNVPSNDSGTQGIKQIIDPACQKRLDSEYQAAVRGNAMANNLMTTDNGGIIKPVAPVLETCDNTAAGNLDYACLRRNQNATRAYNDNTSIYNLVTAQQVEAEKQIKNNIAARFKSSSTDAVGSAEVQAIDGQKKQSALSTAFMVTSIGFGIAYVASCPIPCNGYFAAASAAAAVLSAFSKKQAEQNANTAFNSCIAYNRMASTPKECGAPPPPESPATDPYGKAPDFPFAQVNPATGQCLPSAPPTCQTNLDDTKRRGLNIQDVLKKGPSAFAGPNAPFHLKPDGSVTMKDGKTYKPEDFASKEAMIAAGMSPADANALSKDLFGKDGAFAKAGLDPKADLASMPKSLGSFDMGAGGSSTVKGALDDKEKLGLGAKDMNSGAGGSSRKPTNEDADGLVRNFNGDSIGISNDDIFKMMNKRYNLKSAQDSFIGQ